MQTVYNDMYENLDALLDYCSDINTEQVKQELKDFYIQSCKIQNAAKGEKFLDTEEYEELCYQP